MSANSSRLVYDSTRNYTFDPDSLPHWYTYDGNGRMLTDTVWDGAFTFTQTYTYDGATGYLTQKSMWVKQGG